MTWTLTPLCGMISSVFMHSAAMMVVRLTVCDYALQMVKNLEKLSPSMQNSLWHDMRHMLTKITVMAVGMAHSPPPPPLYGLVMSGISREHTYLGD